MKRLCYRKWLMLFSLKLQRDNRQNALAKDSAKGKTGEKGRMFTVLWRWNTHMLWQNFLFPQYAENRGFSSSFFHWWAPWLGHFMSYSFGIWLCHSMWVFCCINRLCYRKWLMLFPWNSKGITGKMPWPWIPPRGKPEKKAVFSSHCGDETTINYNRAILFELAVS